MKTNFTKSFGEGMCLLIFVCTVILALTLIGLFSARAAHAGAAPVALRTALYRASAGDAISANSVGKDGCVTLLQQSLRACFDDAGERFLIIGGEKSHQTHAPMLALSLAAFGRGAGLKPILDVRPEIGGNRVSYANDGITEWWQVLPVGFEQGFIISKRPDGKGKLVIALDASRSGELRNDELAWGRVHYGKLVVTDANGKIVPATLKSEGDRILIAVSDSHASYPLTVDPLVWLQQKVVANDGGQYENFGTSFALSGNTALIGVPHATVGTNQLQGAVYVFSDENGTWTQTQKLTASDGASGDNFGISIALDGDTAIIGAYDATVGNVPNLSQGAAYVFTESGGTWTQKQKLTASDGSPYAGFGLTVALDGTTAIVGAYSQTVGRNVYQGAAYVFNYANGGWTQTQELTASDGATFDNFSNSLAFVGSTALIGASNAAVGSNGYQGKVYVFTNAGGGTWDQAQILTAADGAAQQRFGNAVALDGTTALIGDSGATVGGNVYQGSVYVFADDNGIWTQTQELAASDGTASDGFGFSVALDGDTALIGAANAAIGSNNLQGAAYLFADFGGSWTQTAKLIATDGAAGDGFGDWVALDGTNALIGAYNATIGGNFAQGAAYFLGQSDLGLAVSAPAAVNPGSEYTSQIIATNSASRASPGVSIVTSVPPEASLVSAAATQGSCSSNAGLVSCDFGAVDGNAGAATASIKLKVIHIAPAVIENTASVVGAAPPLTASAMTAVVGTPVAQDGTLSTEENKAASGNLKATSPSGASLTYSIVAQPVNGTLVLSNATTGAYTYTPTSGFAGHDLFTFKANDGSADSNVASVSVTVAAGGAPTAQDGRLSTDKNKPANGILKATSPSGAPLTYGIVSQPVNGALVLADAATGAYTYTPNRGFVGHDLFTFKVTDGNVDSNVATVNITVKASHQSSGGGAFGDFVLVVLLAVMLGGIVLRRRN